MGRYILLTLILSLAISSAAAGVKASTVPAQPGASFWAIAAQDADFKAGNDALAAREYEKAVMAYTRYLNKYPADAAGYYNRGLAYLFLKLYESSLADSAKALELDPKMVDSHINRGVVYNELKKYELAISEYTQAIQKGTKNLAIAHRNRGNVYTTLGKTDLANADFARAKQIEEQASGGSGQASPGGSGTSGGSGGMTNANGVSWMPVVEMDKNIFPSFFLATATTDPIESQVEGVKGDGAGKIGLHIVNPAANTKVKVGIEIGNIVSYQEYSTTLGIAGKYYQIYPHIVWNWEALKKYKKPSPANATYTLWVNDKLVEKKTVVVRIRSINEAVYSYSYLLDEDRWANTKWVFAAYVNEDHEWIDQLLKEALQLRLVDSFTGYQEDDKKVIRQVFAIWYVLQNRGFRYSSITDTSGSGTTPKVYSQYVRLFQDAINASQANCVDGSVLIASVLKKIGIRVGLILIPGHCYLVFDVTGKGDWRGIETTMMGNVDLESYPDTKQKVDAAVQGFLQALAVGDKRLNENLPKINEGHPAYQFVDIDASRKRGINPIDW